MKEFNLNFFEAWDNLAESSEANKQEIKSIVDEKGNIDLKTVKGIMDDTDPNKELLLDQDNVRAIIDTMQSKSNGYGYTAPDKKFQRYFNAWVVENAIQDSFKNQLTFIDADRDILYAGSNGDKADFLIEIGNLQAVLGLDHKPTLELKIYAEASNDFGTKSFHDADFILILGMANVKGVGTCVVYSAVNNSNNKSGYRFVFNSGMTDGVFVDKVMNNKKTEEISEANIDDAKEDNINNKPLEELYALFNDIATDFTPAELKKIMKKFRFDFNNATVPMKVSNYK